MPRPPETITCASVRSGRPPFSAGARSVTRASFASSDALNATASTCAGPGAGSAETAPGRSATTGVPFRTVACTVTAPPKFWCVPTGDPSPAARSVTSARIPDPVLTASRAAVSLDSFVPATSTAAGDFSFTSFASSSAAGAVTNPAKSAESTAYTFTAPYSASRGCAPSAPGPSHTTLGSPSRRAAVSSSSVTFLISPAASRSARTSTSAMPSPLPR